jgi:hypothetical protein
MGWDFVSELWPPKGLLFIPQVIYKHGELWWNDIDRGKLVHQSSLAMITAESSSSKAGGNGEGKINVCLTKYLFHSWKGSLTCCKILRHGADGFTPLRSKSCCGFLSTLKIHLSPLGVNQQTLGPIASTLTTVPQRTTTSFTGEHLGGMQARRKNINETE